MNDSEPTGLRYSTLGKRTATAEPVITRLMTDALAYPDLLSLAAGFTDNEVLPAAEVADVMAELDRSTPSREHLQYGMNAGRPGLRQAVVDLLRSYPDEPLPDLGMDDVVISNGSQQSLYISAQLFCDPGDIVLVEAPSYFVFLELLSGLGLQAVSMPAHPSGRIDFDALRELRATMARDGRWQRVKLVYFMGVFANPSARCLEEEDKCELGRFVRECEQPLPVIEDMAYRELYFDAPFAARSALSLPEWEGLHVAYAGTFTKPYSTGLKIGFFCSRSHEWIRNLARIKGHQDFGSTNLNQALLEQVCTSGRYTRHLETVRPHYKAKMQRLDTALNELGLRKQGWSWDVPEGGLLMWLTAPAGFDTSLGSAFWKTCLEQRMLYVPGDLCFAEGTPRNCVRLSFGALPLDSLGHAAARFGRAFEICRSRSH